MKLIIKDVLNAAYQNADDDRKDYDDALKQLEQMPEIAIPLTKLLSTISSNYLIKLIEIIDKARRKNKP